MMTTSEEIDQLIALLSHYKPTVRIGAEEELRRLGVEAVPSYLKFIKRERRRFLLKRETARWVGFLLQLPFFAAFVLFWLLLHDDYQTETGLFLLSVSLVPAGIGWILKVFCDTLSELAEKVYTLIGEIRDERLFPVLIDGIAVDRSLAYVDFRDSLIEILPLVTQETWTNLTLLQRHRFFALLIKRTCQPKKGFDADFAMACLKMLGR